MSEPSQQNEQTPDSERRLGGLEHDVVLIVSGVVADKTLGPLIDIGVDKVQSFFQSEPPPPQVEKPPGCDHDR